MAGLNHDFLLVSRDEHDYDDYIGLINSTQAVLLHDDLVSYLSDTLKWIPCYLPRGKNDLIAYEGLNFYGPTIIKDDGAGVARRIFSLWADLFSNASRNLNLTGNFSWTEDKGVQSGKYDIVEAETDEVVISLRQISGFAQQVESSSGKLFLLHLGI